MTNQTKTGTQISWLLKKRLSKFPTYIIEHRLIMFELPFFIFEPKPFYDQKWNQNYWPGSNVSSRLSNWEINTWKVCNVFKIESLHNYLAYTSTTDDKDTRNKCRFYVLLKQLAFEWYFFNWSLRTAYLVSLGRLLER